LPFIFCERRKIDPKVDGSSADAEAVVADDFGLALATGFFFTGATGAGFAAESVVSLAGCAAGFCGGSG